MLPPLLDKSRPSPADKWLWALLGALVAGQIAAIWMLCQQQVDKAQVREVALRVQRMAAQEPQRPATDVNAVMAALR